MQNILLFYCKMLASECIKQYICKEQKTKTMKQIRSKVLSIAHQIKGSFKTWGQAQKAAWMIVKLNLSIEQEITFVKAEGEIRTAKALFAPNLETIEKGFVRFVEWVSEGVEQWRSFRIERLLV